MVDTLKQLFFRLKKTKQVKFKSCSVDIHDKN
jgi:hypothetical protein